MTSPESASTLYARLQLVAPGAHSVLVAPLRASGDAKEVAQSLVDGASAADCQSRLVDVEAEGPKLATVQRAREALNCDGTLTVSLGHGLLDRGQDLLAAAAVDAVVLVVRRGRTMRTDLERARLEVERAGGRIVGAVLQR